MCVFFDFMKINKMRDARTIIFHQVSRRDLSMSEKQRIPLYLFVSRKQTGWGPIGKTVPSWMGSQVLQVHTIYGVTPSQYLWDFLGGMKARYLIPWVCVNLGGTMMGKQKKSNILIEHRQQLNVRA